MNFIVDAGRGPNVLFLHGMPSPAAGLEPFWKPLLGGHRVLVPELPGYGKSPPVDGPYDFARVNALLMDALTARGVRDLAGVVGFSGGSYRALLLALKGLIPVGRVALLAGMAGPEEAERPVYAQFAVMIAAGPLGADFVNLTRERMLSPGFRQDNPGRVPEIDGWMRATTPAVLAAEMEAYARAPNVLGRLGALDVPLLARVGELDAACPPPKSEAIARAAKRAQLQVVPGVGHALPLEDAEGTAAAVARFLA